MTENLWFSVIEAQIPGLILAFQTFFKQYKLNLFTTRVMLKAVVFYKSFNFLD